MIFDGHCDIFTDVLRRRLCGETQVLAHSHLPKLRAGGIRGGCFVLWVDPPFTDDPAARMAQLLSAVAAEMAECNEAALVTSATEIESVAATERFPILLGVEGLSAIGEDVDAIDRFHAFGARHAMLTWNEANALATGAKADPSRGLTELGRRALARLEDLHMLVDVSHLNDRSFWDVLAAVHGPIVASHSNARALAEHPRDLTDDQLRAIAETGGLVGLNTNKNFVSPDPAQQTVDQFVRHAVHIAELVGVRHLAFGFDFNEYLADDATTSYNDGGNPNVPGLEDASRTPVYVEALRRAGFSDDELSQISWQNWLRVIGEVVG